MVRVRYVNRTFNERTKKSIPTALIFSNHQISKLPQKTSFILVKNFVKHEIRKEEKKKTFALLTFFALKQFKIHYTFIHVHAIQLFFISLNCINVRQKGKGR